MPRLFGTDGVRGLANVELTPVLALRLAAAAVAVLGEASQSRGVRPTVVVGRDPRVSGEMLEAAVAAGLASAGADVTLLGILPTPAVAFLTDDLRADFGVVISASHNAMPDNGIKIYGPGGRKLDDATEDAIEAAMEEPGAPKVGAAVGRIAPGADSLGRYVDHLVKAVPHPLTGLTVVVDCANGAASTVAPEAYRRAGATVHVIAGEPDGLNINDGVGSTHAEGLQAAVVEHGADLGIAHDGDADRCLAVDAAGKIVDGDAILALLAISARGRGRLAKDTVVTTVMSNVGFHKAMGEAGIAVRTTAVGDRYVLEEMIAGGFNLGGEQSGHIVVADHATTGDGLLTALLLMSHVRSAGSTLAEIASVVTPFPQVLLNVKVTDKESVASSSAVRAAVAEAESELGDAGRVLLRPSGTEPVVRVMVEAPTAADAERIAGRVAAIVGRG